MKPIEGLIAPEEIEFAARDWLGACDIFHRHAANRSKEIRRVMPVHRDLFEPIMVVLEADSRLSEYRRIADEILKRIPDEDRHPRAAAEAAQSFLLLRLGLHLGLRQRNLRQLLVGRRPFGDRPRRLIRKFKRDAFKAIHSAVEGMNAAGAIDKETMRTLDEDCLAVPSELTLDEIKALREKNYVSQPVFDRYLNTSQSTVQKWETGARRTSWPALKLLSLVQKHGLQMLA